MSSVSEAPEVAVPVLEQGFEFSSNCHLLYRYTSRGMYERFSSAGLSAAAPEVSSVDLLAQASLRLSRLRASTSHLVQATGEGHGALLPGASTSSGSLGDLRARLDEFRARLLAVDGGGEGSAAAEYGTADGLWPTSPRFPFYQA